VQVILVWAPPSPHHLQHHLLQVLRVCGPAAIQSSTPCTTCCRPMHTRMMHVLGAKYVLLHSYERLPSYLRAGLQLPRCVVRSEAQFRLDCHPSRVDCGRFTRLAYEQRVYLCCNQGSVDKVLNTTCCLSMHPSSVSGVSTMLPFFQGPSCVHLFMSQVDQRMLLVLFTTASRELKN
jgi:hypothetical protein